MFDDYLRGHEVIFPETRTDSVHNRLDRGVKKFGPDHQVLDDWHSEKGIRQFLRNMDHITSQDTKTDLLRVGLGHIVLDEMKYRSTDASSEDLIKSAYRSFVQRGFYRKRY